MIRHLALTATAALAGVTLLAGSPAGATSLAGTTTAGTAWAAAKEVPGTAALNTGGNAGTTAISCASAGNCALAGSYEDSQDGLGGIFVASRAGGTWGKAAPLPGFAQLTKDSDARVASISCASAGNCTLGGYYGGESPPDEPQQSFVASEVNGTWGKAEEVPGSGKLNTLKAGTVLSVSCGSAGNCTLGGTYTAGNVTYGGYVDTQVDGVWGQAEQTPGTAALNAGGNSATQSVSCASAGNCSAGGYYTDAAHHGQAYVINQVNGVWRKAEEVPGTGKLNVGGAAQVSSVSCASAGNCSAVGTYSLGGGDEQGFVVGETDGTWGTAHALTSSAGTPVMRSVSCASVGNCAAAGGVSTLNSDQPAVASEVNGVWGQAEVAPGSAALNQGGRGRLSQVSCGSAGNCSAIGTYDSSAGITQELVISEVNGAWNDALAVPGYSRLNAAGNGDDSNDGVISCGSASSCTAGGTYSPSSDIYQAYLVNRS